MARLSIPEAVHTLGLSQDTIHRQLKSDDLQEQRAGLWGGGLIRLLALIFLAGMVAIIGGVLILGWAYEGPRRLVRIAYCYIRLQRSLPVSYT